jgi:hypothetical protein
MKLGPEGIKIRLRGQAWLLPLVMDQTISREAVYDVLDRVPTVDPIFAAMVHGKGSAAHSAQEGNVHRRREALVREIKRALEGRVHDLAWALAKEVVPDDDR